MLAFLAIGIALLVTELTSGVTGELFLRVGEGFLFAVELRLLEGEIPRLVMLLLCEGEIPRLYPALAGELPLLVMLLTGDGDQPVLPRAGELPLAEGEDPRTNVLVPPVDGVATLEGLLLRVPVLARLPGDEVTEDALVNLGEELWTTLVVFAAVATDALLAELDPGVDGELDRNGSRGEPDDLVVEVDLGEDEPLELNDAVAGLGFFVEVVKAGRGLLEDVEICPCRGLLDVLTLDLSRLLLFLMGLGLPLGAGSTTVSILCYNQAKRH